MAYPPLPITTMLGKIMYCWNCLPSPEIDVLVALATGFLSPASPIPANDVRVPFEDITPSWVGDIRRAWFEKLYGIVYTEFEVGGVTLEVASSNTIDFFPLWFYMQDGTIPAPPARNPCETRPFPR